MNGHRPFGVGGGNHTKCSIAVVGYTRWDRLSWVETRPLLTRRKAQGDCRSDRLSCDRCALVPPVQPSPKALACSFKHVGALLCLAVPPNAGAVVHLGGGIHPYLSGS